MEDFNTYEYATEQKIEGKYLAFRIALLGFYALFAGAYFLVAYISRIIPIVAILPIFIWMLVFFTWKYTTPDYKYTIESGKFIFSVGYTKNKKKEKASFKISKAEAILPLETAREKVAEFSPVNSYSSVPSIKSHDVYVALYTDEGGKKCAMYFVATSQALRLLHFHNSRTEVTKTEV